MALRLLTPTLFTHEGCHTSDASFVFPSPSHSDLALGRRLAVVGDALDVGHRLLVHLEHQLAKGLLYKYFQLINRTLGKWSVPLFLKPFNHTLSVDE